jgi:hypothetical protein
MYHRSRLCCLYINALLRPITLYCDLLRPTAPAYAAALPAAATGPPLRGTPAPPAVRGPRPDRPPCPSRRWRRPPPAPDRLSLPRSRPPHPHHRPRRNLPAFGNPRGPSRLRRRVTLPIGRACRSLLRAAARFGRPKTAPRFLVHGTPPRRLPGSPLKDLRRLPSYASRQPLCLPWLAAILKKLSPSPPSSVPAPPRSPFARSSQLAANALLLPPCSLAATSPKQAPMAERDEHSGGSQLVARQCRRRRAPCSRRPGLRPLYLALVGGC